MSSSNHPIIILSDSDIEDAFSSTNVPDYFPATPGNTSPDSSNDLTMYLLATLVFSPLHDDLYMEVMQAYDTTDNELPIPPLQAPIAPPTVMSPSSMPPKRTSTSATPAMTQAAIRQLVAVSVATALEAQVANMENTDNTNGNSGLRETHNAYAQPIGIKQANKITWTELKRLLTNKYCPRTDVKIMEDEFYGLTVKGNDLKTYIRRFQELAILYPNMLPNTEKLMEAFIGGLPQSIEGNVTASKPQTLEEVITITQRLMEQVIKHNYAQEANDHKRKFDDRRNTTDNNNYPKNRNNNNYQDNRNNNNRNHDHHQHNKRQETFRTYAATNGYTGNSPLTKRLATGNNLQQVSVTCNACGEKGHYANQCSKANNKASRELTY
ncbi:reverse transcriptase domain-containing protein [Tanacetum coccineum]